MSVECSGNPLDVILCWIAPNISGPVFWIFSCATLGVGWLIKSEWSLLGQPINTSFQAQIDRIRSKAIGEPLEKHYRHLLNVFLDSCDQMFGPVSTDRNHSLAYRWFNCQPWTAISYERLLNIAIAYPIFFVIAGRFVVQTDEAHWTYTPSVLTSMVIGYYCGFKVKQQLQRVPNLILRNLLIVIIGIGTGSALILYGGFGLIPVEKIFFTAAGITFTISATGAGGIVIAGVYIGFLVSQGFTLTNAALTMVAAFLINILRDKLEQHLMIYWIVSSCVFFASYCALALVLSNNAVMVPILFLVFLPLLNAPLDWLSLGMTRGLLNRIAIGTDNSIAALTWALFDVILALILLIGVGISSFIAFYVAVQLDSSAFYSIDSLVKSISGGDKFSAGIWFMLASTLIPTFLHFLVALMAFVSLPFSRERAWDTVKKLQTARDEAVRRVNEDSNQSVGDVTVDAYARRWAMAYFVATWPTVLLIWFVLVSVLCYALLDISRWLFITLFSLF